MTNAVFAAIWQDWDGRAGAKDATGGMENACQEMAQSLGTDATTFRERLNRLRRCGATFAECVAVVCRTP